MCRYFVLDGASNVSVTVACMAKDPKAEFAWLRMPSFGEHWTKGRILPRLEKLQRSMDFIVRP